MSYWDGSKKSSHPKKTSAVQYTEHLLASPGIEISEDLMPLPISRPNTKFTFEQEFLLALMRLRLGLLVEDFLSDFVYQLGRFPKLLLHG